MTVKRLPWAWSFSWLLVVHCNSLPWCKGPSYFPSHQRKPQERKIYFWLFNKINFKIITGLQKLFFPNILGVVGTPSCYGKWLVDRYINKITFSMRFSMTPERLAITGKFGRIFVKTVKAFRIWKWQKLARMFPKWRCRKDLWSIVNVLETVVL